MKIYHIICIHLAWTSSLKPRLSDAIVSDLVIADFVNVIKKHVLPFFLSWYHSPARRFEMQIVIGWQWILQLKAINSELIDYSTQNSWINLQGRITDKTSSSNNTEAWDNPILSFSPHISPLSTPYREIQTILQHTAVFLILCLLFPKAVWSAAKWVLRKWLPDLCKTDGPLVL